MVQNCGLLLSVACLVLLNAASQAGAQLPDSNEQTFPADSPRLVRGLMICPCSPSDRGMLKSATDTINRGLRIANDALNAVLSSKDPGVLVQARIEAKERAEYEFRVCQEKSGFEACINAAAAVRKKFVQPLCAYDSNTGRNVKPAKESFATVGICSASKKFESPALILGASSPHVTPTPRSSQRASSKPQSISTSDLKPKWSPSSAPKPKKKQSSAPKPIPRMSIAPLPPSSMSTSPKSKQNLQKTSAPLTSQSNPSPTTSALVKNNRNEGCVAIEHLHGYKLQHRYHLRREVLCAHRFCATANHEIEVNGERTSMKKMCSEGAAWKCVQTVKLVNNLKLAYNLRARISEVIVVTPYDHRFPRFVVWIVQMTEDAFNLLFNCATAAFIAALPTLLLAQKK